MQIRVIIRVCAFIERYSDTTFGSLIYMYNHLNEPIIVLARFESKKIIPLNFEWGGRIYDNLRLNLVYKERQGRTALNYFCVDDGSNYFKLQFNGESLRWRIIEYGDQLPEVRNR